MICPMVKARRNGRMALTIRANSSMGQNMGRAAIFFQTAPHMKATSSRIYSKEKEDFRCRMGNTKALSIKVACRVGECSNGKTALCTKDNTVITVSMVEGSTFQYRESLMKEIGRMVFEMAVET